MLRFIIRRLMQLVLVIFVLSLLLFLWLRALPGGIVSATFVPGPDGAEHVVLAGPAEIVARGVFA